MPTLGFLSLCSLSLCSFSWSLLWSWLLWSWLALGCYSWLLSLCTRLAVSSDGDLSPFAALVSLAHSYSPKLYLLCKNLLAVCANKIARFANLGKLYALK